MQKNYGRSFEYVTCEGTDICDCSSLENVNTWKRRESKKKGKGDDKRLRSAPFNERMLEQEGRVNKRNWGRELETGRWTDSEN